MILPYAPSFFHRFPGKTAASPLTRKNEPAALKTKAPGNHTPRQKICCGAMAAALSRVSFHPVKCPLPSTRFVIVSPFLHRIEDRAHAFPNFGKRILHPRRNFRIDGSLNQSDMLKLFECLRKHFSQFLFFGKYPSFCTYLFDIQNNTIFASTRKTIIMKV